MWITVRNAILDDLLPELVPRGIVSTRATPTSVGPVNKA
jgi:hypothetical protein